MIFLYYGICGSFIYPFSSGRKQKYDMGDRLVIGLNGFITKLLENNQLGFTFKLIVFTINQNPPINSN